MILLRFITQPGIVDKVIRMVTWIGHGTKYSHVEFVVPQGYLGASTDSPSGVAIRPLDYCNPKHEAFGMVACNDLVTKTVLDFANKQLDKKYDYAAVVGDLFHQDWTEKDRWDCSGLVLASFMAGGYPLLDLEYPKWATPEEIALSPLVSLNVKY